MCCVMVLQKSVYDFVAVASVGQSSVMHNKAAECNIDDNLPEGNFSPQTLISLM